MPQNWITGLQKRSLLEDMSHVIWEKARAKNILLESGVKNLHVQELDHHENGVDLQEALKEITGKSTVPQVFIKGKFIGGGDETSSLYESGELTKMLHQHGITSNKLGD
eukprot:gene279-9929_t